MAITYKVNSLLLQHGDNLKILLNDMNLCHSLYKEEVNADQTLVKYNRIY